MDEVEPISTQHGPVEPSSQPDGATEPAFTRHGPSASAIGEDLFKGNAPAVADQLRRFPQTRYQGSKRKLLPWLAACLGELSFATALDAFSGTGSVAYLLKAMGKRVTCNDGLRANAEIGIGLIENDCVRLVPATVRGVLEPDGRQGYPRLIGDTFSGIYFTDEENAWLDRAVTHIRAIADRFERALAWQALFQAALAKRPYNLFHRRNLYMRTADVPRSFGNKPSWDRPFADHFRKFAAEANAAVFGGRQPCRATCGDACAVRGDFDLVYIDPPYVNARGVGVDYAHFYHFLEGLVDYANWAARIDHDTKHRRMRAEENPWTNPRSIAGAFDQLFARFKKSQLAVSYRSDGIPAIDDLVALLRRHGRRPRVHELRRYQYALSTQRNTREVLLIVP